MQLQDQELSKKGKKKSIGIWEQRRCDKTQRFLIFLDNRFTLEIAVSQIATIWSRIKQKMGEKKAIGIWEPRKCDKTQIFFSFSWTIRTNGIV